MLILHYLRRAVGKLAQFVGGRHFLDFATSYRPASFLDPMAREFFIWRPRCLRCNRRRPELAYGCCFDCTMDEIEDRTRQDILGILPKLLAGETQ